jgi:hypothetical protein
LETRKIVVEISGGLGNQLFQLAAAKNLDNQGYKVFIDSIYNEINGFRATEINDLARALRIPAVKRSLFLINLLKMPVVKKIYISKLRKKTIFEKINFGKPVIPTNNMNFRLFGYWQNISLANEIRDRLSELLKSPPIDGIALHIRRGDYLSKQHSLHGALDGRYYLKALEKLNQKRSIQKVVIFTDSPEIVKQEEWIQLLNYSKVSFSNSIDPWETLIEMARYSAIICSNSTFSWWAAFIGESKEVFMPDRWFKDTLFPVALRIPGSQLIESTFI